MSELKACPFCGIEPKLVSLVTPVRYFYRCPNCGLGNELQGFDRDEARRFWNTRPIEDKLAADNARLTAELAMQKSLVAAREQDLNELHIALSQLREYTLKNENIIRDLRERTRWIPVSERLPEREDKSCIGERYLVLYFNYFEDICVYAPYDKLWFREGVDKTEYVTHWMPLPEPPEEK